METKESRYAKNVSLIKEAAEIKARIIKSHKKAIKEMKDDIRTLKICIESRKEEIEKLEE